MEKKLYSKPLLRAEQFTPQEFVAACVPSPSGFPTPVSTSDYYKVDGIETDGTHTASKLDGLYNTSEQVTIGTPINDTWVNHFFVQGASGGYYFHIEKAYTSISSHMPYAQGKDAYDSYKFGGPVALIHQTKRSGSGMASFFLLSNEWKGDNIDNYMSIIKNNS